jgi:RNA polymerase subunit RPABC4/transcription elongation factor Spt4
MRCRHCGAVFDDSHTSCPKCGRDPDKSGWFRRIGVALVVLILLVMLLSLFVR